MQEEQQIAQEQKKQEEQERNEEQGRQEERDQKEQEQEEEEEEEQQQQQQQEEEEEEEEEGGGGGGKEPAEMNGKKKILSEFNDASRDVDEIVMNEHPTKRLELAQGEDVGGGDKGVTGRRDNIGRGKSQGGGYGDRDRDRGRGRDKERLRGMATTVTYRCVVQRTHSMFYESTFSENTFYVQENTFYIQENTFCLVNSARDTPIRLALFTT